MELIIWIVNLAILGCGIIAGIGCVLLGVPFLILKMLGVLKDDDEDKG